MTAAKGNRKSKSRAKEDGALKVYRKLISEKKGLLPKRFAEQVEQDLTGSGKYAISRRMALAYLEIPWRQHVEQIRRDRDLAVSVAHVSDLLEGHLQAYKSLVEWLEAAHIRMSLSLCARRDMKAVVAEGKRHTAEASTPAGKREFAEQIAKLREAHHADR